jgi:hypothetical protein
MNCCPSPSWRVMFWPLTCAELAAVHDVGGGGDGVVFGVVEPAVWEADLGLRGALPAAGSGVGGEGRVGVELSDKVFELCQAGDGGEAAAELGADGKPMRYRLCVCGCRAWLCLRRRGR